MKYRISYHDGSKVFEPTISDILGQVFTEVSATEDELKFKNDKGTFTFYHEQNCCECVEIEDITGDLNDLVGEPILLAEESSNNGPTEPEDYDSHTWTFYKFATRKGYVDVRWHGSSNGYYSEEVDLKYEEA